MDSFDNCFDNLSLNQTSEETQINEANPEKRMYLSTKTEPKFLIEIDSKIIEASEILRNVSNFTTDSESVIEVDMSPTQLQKFCDLHNHFLSGDSGEDSGWVCQFFCEMTDEDFRELCWKADYLDSERFLRSASIYLLKKLEIMKVEEFRNFLGIIDDYTNAEKTAMEIWHFRFLFEISMGKQLKFRPQNFAFPKPLIHFTFSVSRIPWNLFYKLYSTCKYFFGILKLIPCSEIYIEDNITFFEANNVKGIRISFKNFWKNISKLNANFYVCQKFLILEEFPAEFWPEISKKIIRQDLSHAVVHKHLKMTLKEFAFLFSNVEILEFFNPKVIDSVGREVPLEVLWKELPKVRYFLYGPVSSDFFTSGSLLKMAALNRNVKLERFTFVNSGEVDREQVEIFAKKQMTRAKKEFPKFYIKTQFINF